MPGAGSTSLATPFERLLAEAGAAGVAPVFLAGLQALTGSLLGQARLTEAGAVEAAGALRRAFDLLVQVSAWADRQPADADAVIDRPVVVTGMHRSGTTYLQSLLARHTDVRAPVLWELMHPVPSGPGEDRADLIARTQAYVAAYGRAAPRFRALHPIDANLPEECHRLLGATFCSGIYELRYRVPGYASWLRTADLTLAYRYHRLLLRALLSRLPGRRVLLKCPLHVRHLEALQTTYPDAVVVQLHREPAEVIASATNLVATIRATRSDRIDRAEIGSYWLRQTELMAAQAMAAPRPGANIVHVRYRDLVERPATVIADICRRAQLTVREPAEPLPSAAIGWARGAGAAAATAIETGLNRRQIDQRFAGYREQFCV